MGYAGERHWKATEGRLGLAVARGDRRSARCAREGSARETTGDHLLAADGRKSLWWRAGTTDARGNVRGAKRARGHRRPSSRNASSRVVRERKLAASGGADHAGSLRQIDGADFVHAGDAGDRRRDGAVVRPHRHLWRYFLHRVTASARNWNSFGAGG